MNNKHSSFKSKGTAILISAELWKMLWMSTDTVLYSIYFFYVYVLVLLQQELVRLQRGSVEVKAATAALDIRFFPAFILICHNLNLCGILLLSYRFSL